MADENNIKIIIDENDNDNDANNDSFDFKQMMADLENQIHYYKDDDDMEISKIMNYKINYSVKELMLICDYYKISKEIKANKYNKEQIIDNLIMFENNPINEEIVCKRKNMWFYITELKNDKFMRKYVLW